MAPRTSAAWGAHAVDEQPDRDRDADERHEDADADEPADEEADPRFDLLQREPQAGLEEDHAHRERDERLEDLAEQHVRLHRVGEDPGDEAHRQQHDDGRQPREPRDQLRADRQDDDQPEPEEDLVGGEAAHPASAAEQLHAAQIPMSTMNAMPTTTHCAPATGWSSRST